MRHLSMRVTLAVTAATIISPVQAQTASPAIPPPQRPPAVFSSNSFPYPFSAPTPEDAYREGLINRWNYEQLCQRQKFVTGLSLAAFPYSTLVFETTWGRRCTCRLKGSVAAKSCFHP